MEGYSVGSQQDAHEFLLQCISQVACDARLVRIQYMWYRYQSLWNITENKKLIYRRV